MTWVWSVIVTLLWPRSYNLDMTQELWPGHDSVVLCIVLFANAKIFPNTGLTLLHLHPSLNREGRWGTTDDFTTSFLHFSLFSTALWKLANSRPVYSLMLSSYLFFCLPPLLPPFTMLCKMVLARPDERETCSYYCSLHLSIQWSSGPHVVHLPAGSWYGLPRWNMVYVEDA